MRIPLRLSAAMHVIFSIIALAVLLLPAQALAEVPYDVVWTSQLGSSAGDFGRAVTTDTSGNVYVAGYTNGALDDQTSAGGTDIFLTKYDSSGAMLWTRQLGTSDTDRGFGVASDGNGNAYVTGYTLGALDDQTSSGSYDMFVTKYDVNGVKQWTRQLGTWAWDSGLCAATDTSGNVYVTGFTIGAIDEQASSGDRDGFITKYDTDGVKIWTRQFGTSYSDNAYGVATDTVGNVIVTGLTSGVFDNQTSAGLDDIFVAKYDENGVEQWTRQLGTAAVDWGLSAATDTGGSIYVTGYTNGALDEQPNAGYSDAFIAKYDSDGVRLWTRQIGTPLGDTGYSVTTDTTGNIYVAGGTGGSLDGQPSAGLDDIFVVKYDTNGVKLWTKQFGTTGYDFGLGISADAAGNVFAAGYTHGTFNGQTNAGDYDMFLAKLLSPPVISDIASPVTGAVIQYGNNIAVEGTAEDRTGSGLAAVDVSTDGGASWEPGYDLSGLGDFTTWGYDWLVPPLGTYSIRSRATNNNSDVEPLRDGVTVRVAAMHTLTAEVDPPGTGTLSFSPVRPGNVYEDGETVWITASPYVGYAFDGWNGEASGANNPLMVSMDSDKTVIANMSIARQLTLTANPAGSAAFSFSPARPGNVYSEGETVWVTATPNSGYVFGNWTGDASGTANPVMVTMDTDKSVAADMLVAHQLNAYVNPPGFGSVSFSPMRPNGIYEEGETVWITVTGSGCRLDYWSGDAAGSENPVMVTMDGDRSVTANMSDPVPPVSNITSPADGGTIAGAGYAIAGTSDDRAGSGVQSVEVSIDGGPWQPAVNTSEQYYTLDSTGSTGAASSIALDGSDKAHISYYGANHDLKYATNASGFWGYTTLDGATDNVGLYTSLALDGNGKEHISYYDVSYSRLKYATNVSGSWTCSTLENKNNVGKYSSIATDSAGNVHISYFDFNQADLKYATNAAGFWSYTTVDAAGYIGLHTSIALDGYGKAHISYYDTTNGDLKYSTNASGSWVNTTVDNGGLYQTGSYASIALDTNGKAHISYYHQFNCDLEYATNATGSWVITSLDSAGDVGRGTSIALDAYGKVYISYYDATNHDLKYATNASGSWVYTTLDGATADVGWDTSLALDGNRRAHISYPDSTNHKLKYAVVAPQWSTWQYVIDTRTLSDGQHVIQVRATDLLGNVEIPGAGITVTVDNAALPTSSITEPSGGAAIKGAIYTVTGTASDIPDGVQSVEVSTDGGGSWSFANYSSGTWSYDWTLPADGIYAVWSRATDTLDNVQDPVYGVSVRVDNAAPASVVTAPADGSNVYGAYCTVTCTAADGSGSGVSSVEVSTDGGVTWSFANYNSGSWSYDWPLPADGPYNIKSRATDMAGNTETPGAGISVNVVSNHLSIVSDPPGTAIISYSPMHPGDVYSEGEAVWITATPRPGYSFTGWSGDASGTDNPVMITMNGNKSVSANMLFTPEDHKWSYMVGLHEWSIRDVAISPDYANDSTVFVQAGYYEIFRSTDGAASWADVYHGFMWGDVAISPEFADDGILLIPSNKTIMRSTDRGDTWVDSNAGCKDTFVVALSPDFGVDHRAYGGHTCHKLTRSMDSGATFFGVNTNMPSDDTLGIAVPPGYLGTRVYTSNSGRLYLSTNGGASFSQINTVGPRKFCISPGFISDQVMFGYYSGVRKSVDGGYNWVYLSQAGSGTAMAMSANYPSDQTVYAGGNGQVKISVDGGTIWTELDPGALSNYLVNSLDISPDGSTLFAGTSKGLYKYTFLQLASSITSPRDGAVLYGSAYTVTGTASRELGAGIQSVEVSTDGGGTWNTATDTSGSGSWSTWSYDWTLPADGIYSLMSRVVNADGVREAQGAGVTVTVDNISPVSAITDPADGADIGGSGYTIAGTALDLSGTGIQSVEVSTDGGTSWYGATDTSGNGSWSTWSYDWTIPGGGSYTIKSRATDNDSNVGMPGPGITVTVDNTPPVSVISYPLDSATLSGTSYTITGTSDDGTGLGVQSVEVSTDNGTSWQTAADTSGNGSWSSWNYDWSIPAEGVYIIRSRATDNASYVETPGLWVYVTVDNTPPTSSVSSPYEGSIIRGVSKTIRGDANDSGGSEVQTVEVSIDGGSTWETATGTTSWTYDWTLPAEGDFCVISRATDAVGNVETPGVCANFTVDNLTPPVTTVRLTGGHYYNSIHVDLMPNDNAAIVYYTTDGTTPTTASSVAYPGPSPFIGGDVEYPDTATIEFKYFARNQYGTEETVRTEMYTITPPPWTRVLGSPEEDKGWDVSTDASGNVYVVGDTLGAIDGQTSVGARDVFLTKYDGGGTKLWTRQFGSVNFDFGNGVSTDPNGNVYIAGNTGGSMDGQSSAGGYDMFVTKYDSTGEKLWTRQLGGTDYDSGHHVSTDPSGNVYVSGYTSGSFDNQSSMGGNDVFIAKYDGTGEKLWTRQIGSSNDDYGPGVATDADGNVYISGYTGGSFDNQTSMGGNDAFITKFDTNGIKQWTRQIGSAVNDYGYDVSTDTGGNVYMTGLTWGSIDGQPHTGQGDMFVTKYDSNGVRLWTRQLESVYGDGGYSVSTDSSGNVYIAGVTGGPLDGRPYNGISEVFVAKYNGSGVKLWCREYVSAFVTVADFVSVDPAGNVYLAGTAGGSINGQPHAGRFDMFVMKVVEAPPDTTPPTSSITDPLYGATLSGASYTITGTAFDNFSGAGVQFVEVFTDGGSSWQPATDTSGDGSWSTWEYVWTLPANGAYTILSRATDKAGNIETPGPSVSVTVDNPVTLESLSSSSPGGLVVGDTCVWTAVASGGSGSYQYDFWAKDPGGSWINVQPWSDVSTWSWTPQPGDEGRWSISCTIRDATDQSQQDSKVTSYDVVAPPILKKVTMDVPSPCMVGQHVEFTATASGGTWDYEYKFWLKEGTTWTVVQDYSPDNTWDWTPSIDDVGSYKIVVNVRSAGSSVASHAVNNSGDYDVISAHAGIGSVDITPYRRVSVGNQVDMTINAIDGQGSGYEYRIWRKNPSGSWTCVMDYPGSATYSWTPLPGEEGTYKFIYYVRNGGTTYAYDNYVYSGQYFVDP